MILRQLLLAASLLFSFATNVQAASSSFYAMNSYGDKSILTEENGAIFVPLQQPGVDWYLQLFAAEPSNWFELTFAGPSNSTLVKAKYDNAIRAGNNGALPGLSFTRNNLGDNSSIGNFEILDIDYNTDGTLNTFAANFTIYHEQLTDRWDIGAIRYKSDIPYSFPTSAVPEPEIYAMLLVGMGLLGLVAQRRKS